MIADTTFLIDLQQERRAGRAGRALRFLHRSRGEKICVTTVSVAEFAAGFISNEAARQFLVVFPMIRLFPEVAFEAANVEREMRLMGERLGENDTLIAGVARYYGEALLTNDAAFGRVPGLRVRPY